MADTNTTEIATKLWLDEVIIGQNFCPFAKPVRKKNGIRFKVSLADTDEDTLQEMVNELNVLDSHNSVETTLVIFERHLKEFDHYLDVLFLLEEQLHALNYDGIYQIASFHPQYIFEGEPSNAVSHYTNRSPFPMFHIIRESSLTAALEQTSSPELIPQRNIAHAQYLGRAFFTPFLNKE